MTLSFEDLGNDLQLKQKQNEMTIIITIRNKTKTLPELSSHAKII